MKFPHGDPTNVTKLHCPYPPHHSYGSEDWLART